MFRADAGLTAWWVVATAVAHPASVVSLLAALLALVCLAHRLADTDHPPNWEGVE